MYIGKLTPATIERTYNTIKLHRQGVIWQDIAKRFGINRNNAISYASHLIRHPELLEEVGLNPDLLKEVNK